MDQNSAATERSNAVEIQGLHRNYGRKTALQGLDLSVVQGQCHGFFGRNGAGKTTTIKCLLNHLRPDRGTVRVCGLDPARNEVAVKQRIGYVPDEAGFYPWMTVRSTLDYHASFRPHWNRELENELLEDRFRLDTAAKVEGLSKGMKAQLALICALCPQPELLLLDEPTSGLDPVVRRELIETVIGTYQSNGRGPRTVLVSTHLIAEFQGLIDSFTIIDQGRTVLSVSADTAQQQFRKVHLTFDDQAPTFSDPQVLDAEYAGREVKLTVRDEGGQLESVLRAHNPTHMRSESLSMEEIFIASVGGDGRASSASEYQELS